jgi:hypothetical protein
MRRAIVQSRVRKATRRLRGRSMRSARSHAKARAPKPDIPCAWVAQALAGPDWRRIQKPERAALAIFAISVHDSFSSRVDDRLSLIAAVANRFARRVPVGVPSLWVFPGGYFGFSAAQQQWEEMRDSRSRKIDLQLRAVARRFPNPCLIAVGVDGYATAEDRYPIQQAWVIERRRRRIDISRITRGTSSLAHRQFIIGTSRVAFFICGEFTGSYTDENGPFRIDRCGIEYYLDNPARQLKDSDVLVDLAHYKVSGSVSGVCGPRMVHRRQMERFSDRGIGVLTHHHSGAMADGRPHFKHQSNWIIFRGGDWLPASAVTRFIEAASPAEI